VSNANYIPTPKSIELHLNGSPDFTRKYGHKVKSLGGRYSACRGYSIKRFVDVPWTTEGQSLANELIAEFGNSKRTTVVLRGVSTFRGKHVHAHVVVHYVSSADANPCETALAAYETQFLRTFPEAAFPEPPVVAQPKPLAATLHLTSPVRFWAVLEALQQFIDNGNDAEYLLNGDEADELKAKVRAAEEFRDQLDAVLASLADA
jgi:hypothetical protein